jgi:hypothetical protein
LKNDPRDNAYDPESGEQEATPDPALRRQAIFRVLILTLVLLALPIGMVVWAVRDSMRKPADAEIFELSDEDTASLRATLERVVEDEWGESPSLPPAVEPPALAILEWHVPTEDWARISKIIEAGAVENPAWVVRLQEGALPDKPARFMISQQTWLSVLGPALAEQGYTPPCPDPTPPETSFLFLEIHHKAGAEADFD